MPNADHAPLLERAFDLELWEGDLELTEIEGDIPSWLRGNYYLNGPARFRRGTQRYGHWLDGDGQVSRLRFGGSAGTGNGTQDRVRFTHRFVHGTKVRDEDAAGHALYRTFGTAFEDDQLKHGIGLESPLNVSIYPAAGTLLAFGEQGLPWELDPETLETKEVFTFDGRLNAISPFSAHPKIDGQSGELFNFGVSFAARRPCVHVYRFDAQGASIYRQRLPLDAPRSVHDFALAPHHLVIYLSPYVLDMDALMGSQATLMDALTWRPTLEGQTQPLGSKLLIARRDDGSALCEVELGDRYCLHLVNSFERRDGEKTYLVVDVIELERPVYDQYGVPDHLFEDVRHARPVRFVLDPRAGELVERRELGHDLMCDFPHIDPRRLEQPYDDFWVLALSHTAKPGRKFFDRLVHLSWKDTPKLKSSGGAAGFWQAPPKCYLGGEPTFLPHPEKTDEGLILIQEFAAETGTGAFLLFDAFDVAAGPVARLPLPKPVRLGFHACFEPA